MTPTAIEAVTRARECLTAAQHHLKAAAKLLKIDHLGLGDTAEKAEALIVLVYAFDDQLETLLDEENALKPGSDAIGVACHTCGKLPSDDEPQCSWTNGGKAVCFGCGHG